ncbi:MAG TPA: hypothetical protein VEW08_01710 [Steroidobacteraceae bacterium]|nr:hypothetical protein [Steroidobacteraceae bacterium]
MRTILLALAMLMPLASANADCDPPGLFRIVTANGSPGIPKDSFASRPKVTYRAGNGRVRGEEMADTAGGIHQLSVINWPDMWVVNLLDKTGEHVVDDSPKSDVTIAALGLEPSEGLPSAWASLEFGCEWEFFAANKAKQVPTEKHDMIKHQLTDGAWRVTMITAKDSQVPWALMLSRDNNVVYAIRYLSYEHRDQVDPALFAKPDGIRFKDPLK